MPVAGDLLTPRLDIDPAGSDTLAVLTVIDPDNNAAPWPVHPETGGNDAWAGDPIRLVGGQYRLWWTVTGTGADETTQLVTVDPAPGAVPTGFSFATSGDLVRYTGKPLPDDAARKLINATREIERITKTARYEVDERGYARSTVVRMALADATCELVGWWAESGTETGAGALITNASIAGVSIGYGGKTSGNAQADRVGPRIWSMLLNAGLVRAGGVFYG